MLSRWQSTIVDERGNVQPGAVLTIRNEADQSLAQVFESPSEQQPYPPGTVTADQSGYAYFYAGGGLYRIQSVALGIDWRHVQLGSAASVDAGTGSDEVRVNDENDDRFARLVGGEDADFNAMPMVSGSPIIERGSNANGEYVRFADGTQECRGTSLLNPVPMSSDGSAVWTFPIGFDSAPLVHYSVRTVSGGGSLQASGDFYSNGPVLRQVDSGTESGINIYTYVKAIGSAVRINFTAEGTWK